jgi:hypothetical protein
MNTLNKFAMRTILDHLDSALADTRLAGTFGESNVSWHIRIARDRLLEAAIADVEVEQVAAAQQEAA